MSYNDYVPAPPEEHIRSDYDFPPPPEPTYPQEPAYPQRIPPSSPRNYRRDVSPPGVYRTQVQHHNVVRSEVSSREVATPNSEVVIPPVRGVGTLATQFEKQARLVEAGVEQKKPPPKPLYQREDHRARIDEIQSEIERNRRQQYDYDYSQRKNPSPIRLGTHRSYESRLDRASDAMYDSVELHHQVYVQLGCQSFLVFSCSNSFLKAGRNSPYLISALSKHYHCKFVKLSLSPKNQAKTSLRPENTRSFCLDLNLSTTRSTFISRQARRVLYSATTRA